ncbi:EamA family transporter [Falsiroseomonas sp. E2-1-a20]|uniref:EamA family transporter n=1 Tax=Falsiroseomonas sp. E2-1-a20 TaxID=3239300 RepID=UPI003F326658
MTDGDGRARDLLLTALAPAIWGSSYIVTTQMLPDSHPLAVAMLRALPAGLLLLLFVRQLPHGCSLGRVLVLGVLNFSIFWAMLFVTAYRLPGGLAATIGAVQPLMVLVLAQAVLGTPVRLAAVLSGLAGVVGVALLMLGPEATPDPVGIAAGLVGAGSMALGTVLTRRWRLQVPLLTMTAWQLTAGGLVLLPPALWVAPDLLVLSGSEVLGLAWLGLVGAAFTYVLWFRGIARLGPSAVAPLGLFSPVVAVAIGWLVIGEQPSAPQWIGMVVVVASVAVGQRHLVPKSVTPGLLDRQPSRLDPGTDGPDAVAPARQQQAAQLRRSGPTRSP